MPEADVLTTRSFALLRDLSLQDLIRESMRQAMQDASDPEEDFDGEGRISRWLIKNSRAPRDISRPFAFTGHDSDGDYFDYEFQRQILDDPSQKVVVRKAAQMGISEIMARDCLARLNLHPRTKALYILPTNDDVATFSDTRIRTILEYSPMLRNLANMEKAGGKQNKATDNQGRKRIGDSFLIVRGGWDYRQAQMVDADFLYLDEYERLKENVIPSFENRLSGSKFKLQRAFSTPEIIGKGIDALFQDTDQKHWFDLCWKCEHAQIMGEENIRSEEREGVTRYWYACLKCSAELGPETRRGIWKPTCKSPLNISGYQVSQFMSPTMTAEDMVRKKAGGSLFVLSDYLNLTLGLPAKGGLQDEEQRYGEIGTHSARLEGSGSEETVMAIDWGGTNGSFAEISVARPEGGRKVLWVECFWSASQQDHIERMKELAFLSRANYIVADMGWGQHQNEVMKQHFPTRFWTIMTNSEMRFQPHYFPRDRHIVWGKLRCFKSHFRALAHKLVLLPNESPRIQLAPRHFVPAHEIWVQHHKNVIIRVIDDDKRIDVAHGAAVAREEITQKGPIHLVAVSAYADVMWNYVRHHKDVDDKVKARHETGFKVGVSGGRRR